MSIGCLRETDDCVCCCVAFAVNKQRDARRCVHGRRRRDGRPPAPQQALHPEARGRLQLHGQVEKEATKQVKTSARSAASKRTQARINTTRTMETRRRVVCLSLVSLLDATNQALEREKKTERTDNENNTRSTCSSGGRMWGPNSSILQQLQQQCEPPSGKTQSLVCASASRLRALTRCRSCRSRRCRRRPCPCRCAATRTCGRILQTRHSQRAQQLLQAI